MNRGATSVKFGNELHGFYYDATRGNLRHARTVSGVWHFENLDGDPGSVGGLDGDIGRDATVTTVNGELHVFYYDATRGNLRHAWFTNTGWHFENLDGDPGSTGGLDGDIGRDPFILPWGTAVQLFYYDATRGNLRHALTTTTGWHFATLDGDPGSTSGLDGDIGRDVTATQAANGELHAFYYDATRGNLRHAWFTNTGWHFENLDGDPGSTGGLDGDIGRDPAFLPWGTDLQLFYYDATRGNLRHAWTTSTGWHFENLDGDPGSVGGLDGDIGRDATVTTVNGELHVFYYDATRGNLRHAWFTNTGWHFENLDGDPGSTGGLDGDIGRDPFILPWGTAVQLFYYDATRGNLRHALTTTTGWHFATLDGDPGSTSGLDGDIG